MSMFKKRSHDSHSPSQPEEPSARRQRVIQTPRKKTARSATYDRIFRRDMNSWFQTVTKEITKGFQTSIASKPILATDEEAENSEPVWYLDDAAEYVRRIAMAAYLYGGTPGEVVSFGNDEAYQLGQVSNFYLPRKTEYLPGFVRGAPLYEVRHAAAGGLHSVAITADGQVYSWGSADEGCLGRSSVDPVGDQHEGLEQCTPRVVEGFITQDGEKQDGTMVAASAGDGHTICLSAKGQTFMFGMYKDMDSGKFAHPATPNGSPKGFRERPVHVQMPQSVIAVTCGQSFNAAILADGTMVTWGMGHKGQLGRSQNMTTPDANGNYDLGKNFCYHKVVEDGVVDYTGANEEVILKHFLTPLPPLFAHGLPSLKMMVTGIAGGGHHLLVTARAPGDSTSKLYSCGLNNYGQLGLGDLNDAASDISADRHELTLVKTLEHEHIVKVAAGEHFSLALNIYGSVLYAFGRADYGSLGIDTRKPDEQSIQQGSSITVPTPVVFPGTERTMLSDIACGDRHSLAVTTENEVYSWGFGTTGMTGHETVDPEDIFVPTKLNLKKHLGQNSLTYQISGGGQHTLIVSKRYT